MSRSPRLHLFIVALGAAVLGSSLSQAQDFPTDRQAR